MSIYLLFAMAPFVLRTRRQIVALSATLMSITTVGGIVFLLLPAELAYEAAPDDLGVWTVPYRIASSMALKYNLLPSLHVGLFVACVSIYTARAGLTGKLLLWCWAAALAASTLLLHQHHVLDVVAGWVLGVGGKHIVFNALKETRNRNSVIRWAGTCLACAEVLRRAWAETVEAITIRKVLEHFSKRVNLRVSTDALRSALGRATRTLTVVCQLPICYARG